MTTKLLSTYKQKIKELKLIPSGGGCFELSINGDLIYSKLKVGKYTFTATITDASGQTVQSSVDVTVTQTLTSIAVNPGSASVDDGATKAALPSLVAEFVLRHLAQ